MSAQTTDFEVMAYVDEDCIPCGQLRLTEDGPDVLSSEFRYDPAYLLDGAAFDVDPVSLSLRDCVGDSSRRHRPVNSLSLFGGIRDATPDSWGRRVIEAKLDAPINSLSESEYILHSGRYRSGALEFRQTIGAHAETCTADLGFLPELAEAAALIERGFAVPRDLQTIFDCGASLGGARPKAVVRDNEGVEWVAKFLSVDDRLDVPAIECATLRLADRAGLNAAIGKLVEMGDRHGPLKHLLDRPHVLLSHRFDRRYMRFTDCPEAGTKAGWHVHRIPYASALTMVGCDEMDSRNRFYGDIVRAMQQHCSESVIKEDARELFKRALFDILVSNDDGHLRNTAFLWDASVAGWRLSPLFDVMPRPSNSSDRYLHLALGIGGRQATLDNAVSAHADFGLSEVEAFELVSELWDVLRGWRQYLDEYRLSRRDIAAVAPAFRHIDDIATRGLRQKLP